jgi:hypothetical protein
MMGSIPLLNLLHTRIYTGGTNGNGKDIDDLLNPLHTRFHTSGKKNGDRKKYAYRWKKN